MKTRPRKYKTRPSRLDPYMDEIAEMLASGCTYSKIADEMSLHFDDWAVSYGAVAGFVKRNGLESKVTQGCRNDRIIIPQCDGCESCILVLNTTKSSRVRVCVELKEIVSRSVITSPMECPKRERNGSDAYVHGGNR